MRDLLQRSYINLHPGLFITSRRALHQEDSQIYWANTTCPTELYHNGARTTKLCRNMFPSKYVRKLNYESCHQYLEICIL